MAIGTRLTEKALDHHKLLTWVVAAATVAIALAAALPSIWPKTFAPLHAVQVDTDPENMLAADEPVRVFHEAMKKTLDLHDMVVVGAVNDEHPKGVFNPDSLRKIYELTEYAKGLQWTDEAGGQVGVIARDVIAPSTVDSIEPAGEAVNFRWLMPAPPATQAEADAVLAAAARVPFLSGTMVSEDGKAVCIYLPITRKDLSYRVYSALKSKIAALGGPEQFHVTGLPVAEDTFGVEMFVQMAISAPLAMVVIFALMLVFFRKLLLIVSPLIVAMVSVVLTMGLLIVTGHPIHIMSSMIPIFIMPIAVLDSIHIISEFFERYQQTRDRRSTVVAVMEALFVPMLYTSLTSAAGFASLALTPIPPVQVFGLFVAIGIMAAWALTVTFIPAFVMFIPPRALENFGAAFDAAKGRVETRTRLGRALKWIGGGTYRWAKPILAISAVVLVAAGVGISRININDNPVKWFTRSHPIRVADTVLNEHFGGTYMAYLALRYREPAFVPAAYAADLAQRARQRVQAVNGLVDNLSGAARAIADEAKTIDVFFERLTALLQPDADVASDEQLSAWKALRGFLDRYYDPLAAPSGEFVPAAYGAKLAADAREFASELRSVLEAAGAAAGGIADQRPADRQQFLDRMRAWQQERQRLASPSVQGSAAWEHLGLFLAEQRQQHEVFKRPDVLDHMGRVQQALLATGIVGKSNSLADIVRTVNRDLHGGRQPYDAVPRNTKGVAQCIQQFEQSHRPHDLAHFVTTHDYQTAAIWVQLKSGDNKDMTRVVGAVRKHLAARPPPAAIDHDFFGLTYINVIWQEKMVVGMLQAFAGSFLVVFLLMVILFRSALWGLLSMIPLTVTIAAIYGAVGLVGKDYDMPVAVLSSLTLGLAVDFAIHFLARSRSMQRRYGAWRATSREVFGEPARAIARNIIVIAAGFLPLLFAPLIPYKTVGVLLATILLVSGMATLLLLPALIRVLERRLFVVAPALGPACNCGLCVVSSAAVVALVALNLHSYAHVGFSTLTWISLILLPLLSLACGLLSRREKCRLAAQADPPGGKPDG